MDEAAGYFYVDKSGRTYWSQSKNEEWSGPDLEIGKQSTAAKSSKKSVKQSSQVEQIKEAPSSTDAAHALSSIETTEEFLKANGIAFKVSSIFYCEYMPVLIFDFLFLIDREAPSHDDQCRDAWRH